MSNRATHWCYVCQRPVHICNAGQDVTCPSCNDGFIQQMNEMGRRTTTPRRSSTLGFINPDVVVDAFLGRRRMLEAISTLMRQMDNDDHELAVHGYSRAGLDALFEQLGSSGYYRARLQNQLESSSSRQEEDGPPPPASPSAIDAMPVVTISRRHLRAELRCPVCQDTFELGAEAREMPCGHLYHAGCILPWLVQHNSCPVCRHPLPSPSPANSERASGGERRGSHGSRFLRLFGPSSSGSRSRECEGGSSNVTVYEDPGQVSYYIRWHHNH